MGDGIRMERHQGTNQWKRRLECRFGGKIRHCRSKKDTRQCGGGTKEGTLSQCGDRDKLDFNAVSPDGHKTLDDQPRSRINPFYHCSGIVEVLLFRILSAYVNSIGTESPVILSLP